MLNKKNHLDLFIEEQEEKNNKNKELLKFLERIRNHIPFFIT